MNKPKIVVLVSGEGTLLQALLDQQVNFNYEVALVLSDKENIKALARAEKYGVATQTILENNYKAGDVWYQKILRTIKEVHPDLVVLAGFMRILPETIVNEFANKILNSHPSLLPKFPGLRAVEQALAAGVPETGATMHLVDKGVDTGPIVEQVAVKVLPQDSSKELHQRIKLAEQVTLPKVVDSLVNRNWQVTDGRVVFED